MCQVSDMDRCCFSVKLNITFLIEPLKVWYLSKYLENGYWLIGLIKMEACSRLHLSVLLGLYTAYFGLVHWNFSSFLFQVQDNFDKIEFNRMCWTLCVKKNLTKSPLLITEEDAFKVWVIFNFLSEDKYPLIIVPEEVRCGSGKLFHGRLSI